MRLPSLLYFFFILLTEIFCSGLVKGQTVSISVSDSASALDNAVVRLMPMPKVPGEYLAGGLTDKEGKFAFDFTKPVIIHINYIGYIPIVDTVMHAGNYTYMLRKSSATIEDVVVTGQYAPGSAKASVYTVQVVNEKDFREKGASNLREALQSNIGIEMSQDPVFGSGLSLQGISGEGVKILLDGIPLTGRQDGILDISQINLSNIERVEIIKGPMSALYGSDAMGGVVNLISRSNQPEKVNLNLKGYYESVGQYNFDLNGGLKFGKSQLFFSAGRNFFDGYSVVEVGRHRDWLPKEQYYANARYIYTASRFKLGASLSFLRELMLDRGNLEPQTTYAYDRHYLTMRPVASVFANLPVNTFSKVDILAGYSGYVRFTNYYTKDLVTLKETLLNDPSVIQDTAVYHTAELRGTYTLTTANKILSGQFGVDVNGEYTKQITIAGGAQTIGDYAVFGSILIKPVRGLDIQPAARFSYNTKFTTPIIPSINVKYDISRCFMVRASYGMGYRVPSLKELYMRFKDSNHDLNGNDSLQPENGHSINIGFTFQISKNKHRFKWVNNGFYNSINNKIDYLLTDANSTPNVYKYFNINNYRNAGGEHQVEYSWDRFTAGASVLYTWTRVTLGQTGTAPVSMISPDATVKLGYKIPKAEINVIVSYKYNGRAFLYSLSSTNDAEYGSRAPFHTLNFSLSHNFWKDRIQLTAGGKNLFNVTNVATTGAVPFGHSTDPTHVMVAWGRTAFISLNLHFAK